ncbi:MAG: NAD(P)/FAD-dependent oxidoreductase [Cyclobacteriaceae bacterium]|nr:NAD(P)/FAD-dependent oxidoreductase [Cyclobacteriaceae bacterium]
MTWDLIIIGGGASGIFCAANAIEKFPQKRILVLEKSDKLLSKVRISGGGRCNVTHACPEISNLIKFYPRGGKKLIPLFKQFDCNQTATWFEKRGVKLKTEPDGRVFPVTNSSDTIIECLKKIIHKSVEIRFSEAVQSIIPLPKGGFELKGKNELYFCEHVFVAAGGIPKLQGYNWLDPLAFRIEPPVPSLFTFNIQEAKLHALSGISVKNAYIKISGTKIEAYGPLLITHWGLSGPATLKLSAFGARIVEEKKYQFEIQVRWDADWTEEWLRNCISDYASSHPLRKIANHSLFNLPQRIWLYLVDASNISSDQIWSQLSKKSNNRLIENLFRMPFQVAGKTTYKDEFVTCGGISLDEIDLHTMQSKKWPGLYVGGEILDIDGLTGGFNFQSAWASGYVAAQNIF